MRRAVINSLLALTGLLILGAGCAPASEVPAPDNKTAAATATFPGKAGTFVDEKITVNGEEREYRLEVSPSVDLTKPAPIVFAFHGMGEDNKDHMASTSGLPELAAEHKFILVFPAASAQMLPQGVTVKAWALVPAHIPADLAFFDALLDKLQAQYRIDPQAIFVTGMSNGAYFAHLLGRERSDKIAAVAAHSGELGLDQIGLILTGRKFPVMIIHGDADQLFPVDNARRAREIYQSSGHSVTYVEIPGWPHKWDNRVDEKIWDFFNSHRLGASFAPTVGTPSSLPAPAAHS